MKIHEFIWYFKKINFDFSRKLAKDQFKAQAERNSEALTIKNQEFIAKLYELEELKTKYQKSLLSLSTLEAKVPIFSKT